MLKLSFIIAICFMSATTIASSVFEEKTYSETVECGSVSQLELFRRVRLSIVQSNPTMTILVSDKETGDFVTQGKLSTVTPRTENSSGGSYQFLYVLSVETVNRKYRATISSIEFMDNGKLVPMKSFNRRSDKGLDAVTAELETKVREILADLQQDVKEYKAF